MWRRVAALCTAAGLLFAGVMPAQAGTGNGPAVDKGKTSPVYANNMMYKADPYIVTDPDLVKNPGKIVTALERDGSLDQFGIKSTNLTHGKPVPGALAASDPPYVVDSSLFPRGSKPADPYRYITGEESDAQTDNAA